MRVVAVGAGVFLMWKRLRGSWERSFLAKKVLCAVGFGRCHAFDYVGTIASFFIEDEKESPYFYEIAQFRPKTLNRFPPPMKNRYVLNAALAAVVATLCPFSKCLAELSITEFMASNGTTLADDDGAFSDWIEIYNGGPAAVSTVGYYLTDNGLNLTKWRLPDVIIPVDDYLVVFASGKNRAVPGSTLHTNFSLTAGGEYLALVAPDGMTVLSEFSPAYPQQTADISYGIGVNGTPVTSTIIDLGASSWFLVPTAEPASDWRVVAFDESAWASAELALGYGYPTQPVGAGGSLDTPVMRGKNTSVFVRIPFQIDDPAAVIGMTLKMKVDDGFVAYLNGEQVASDNAPAVLSYNASAVGSSEVADADPFDSYMINFAGKLEAGTNILAFHGLNLSISNSDFLLYPVLEMSALDLNQPLQAGYFETPTPGANNFQVKSAAPSVDFSLLTQTFISSLSLTLTPVPPDATVRYTTNGTVPTEASTAYTGPLSIASTTQIRAKAFLPGSLDGRTHTEGYMKLSADAQALTSDLPIIIIENFGTGAPPESDSTTRKAYIMAIFEPKGVINPRSSALNLPDLVTRSGIRKRGSSSSGWPKYQMSVEAWSETDYVENSINPLGLGGEDDWILSARWEFDRALLRNDFIYSISNQIGRYAAKTRFVELYNNTNGGDVGGTDYFGVYTLMHKLDRDDDRIDVEGLDATITSEPDITGGYIFKKDRTDPGEPSFNVNGMGTLVHIYPDGGPDANKPNGYYITPTQKSWLVNHMNQINTALTSVNGINPATGLHFSEYIDVDSFIDHVLLNTLAMNVDWGRLSAWMHKPRGGKLRGGPIWDFDRNMGSEDGRDANPLAWDGSGDSSRSWFDSRYPWYGRVLGFTGDGQTPNNTVSSRPEYVQKAIDRWFELRKGGFSTANMHATIDGLADQIREAQVRNFVRWSDRLPNGGTYSGGDSSWEGEITHMKGWLQARANWIDGQFPDIPTFSNNGGIVAPGFQLTMNALAGPIYYTTDGSDPRNPDGTIAANAIPFEGGPVDNQILDADASSRYFVPLDDSLGATWTAAGFDDSTWTSATGGVGFETAGSGFFADVTVNISPEMRNISSSCFHRYVFNFTNKDSVNSLLLEVKNDDGFVAYLNGTKLVSRRAPDPVLVASLATATPGDAVVIAGYESIDVSAFKSALVNGNNVLAIHGLNQSKSGSDYLVRAKLLINETVTANPVTLSSSSQVTARTQGTNMWSAPMVANFLIGSEYASASNLVVSEIMYNPVDPTQAEIDAGFLDKDDFEYIELMNAGSEVVDLLEVRATAGFQFDFALDAAFSTLMPGARALIVANIAAFQMRYGHGADSMIAGTFQALTGLSNSGELITLTGIGDSLIRSFSFDDESPWPVAADGGGYSLVLVSPASVPDHGLAASWRASVLPGGNPGAGDATVFAGDGGVDEDGDRLTAFAEYALGTSDLSGASGPAVIVSSVSADGFAEFSFPINLAADDALVMPEVSTDMVTWAALGASSVLVSSIPNGDGTATQTYRITPVLAGELFVRLNITSR
jgi:hypothetical protein